MKYIINYYYIEFFFSQKVRYFFCNFICIKIKNIIKINLINEIILDIKRLTIELCIPVIALAQLSSSIEQRKGENSKPK